MERRKLPERAVNLLIRMVESYSPTGSEEILAKLLKSELINRGFKTRKDEAGNVFGTKGSGNPHILLCGHMDVVSPKLPVNVKNGVLYGRGTTDAKGALAAMLEAASLIPKDELDFRITIGGLVDEEGNNDGVKQLVYDGIDADYAIFGEPTNVDTITIGYKGNLLLEITCTADSGHSSAPWLFENTIEKAMEIWSCIDSLKMNQEKSDSHFFSLSKNLRFIEGGQKSSVTPGRCTIQVGIRFPPNITISELKSKVTKIVNAYRSKNNKIKVKMIFPDYNLPYLADKRSNVAKALSQAIYLKRGKPAFLLNKTGTGDMNVFGPATGIPVVTYGPGNSHLDHTSNEHIMLQDYLASIEVLKEGIIRLVRLHRR